MIYMIKRLSLIYIFFISSCNVFTFTPLIPVFKTAIFGVEDFEITDEFLATREYSFIKVKIGRSAIALFVLFKIDEENNFYWVNSTGEKIVTNNGKIIEISGLIKGNFKYTGLAKRSFPDWKETENFLYLAEFFDPRAYFSFESALEFDDINSVLKEKVFVKDLNWRFDNYYEYKGDLTVHSKQTVHPQLPILTIDYFYK